MKIVLATGLYPPEIGGPTTYVQMLEAELPSRDIQVVTVPFGWVRHYPVIIRHVVYAWKLWKMSRKADIVYAFDPVGVGLPAAFVAKLSRKPFLVRLGGDYAWEQGRVRFGVRQTLDVYTKNHAVAPWRVRVLARLQTYVLQRAVCVVVPSNYLQSIVKQWGIAEEKIKVVHSALYPLEVNVTRDVLRSQLNYPYPTLVSAARLVPWKGLPALITVLGNLQKRYPDISLVIIGEGEERRKLESQVAKSGLSEQVRFTGRISKDALGAALKAADVFVLNTAYEGISHQLIEVMDLGVPIVTTKSGGNPELITNGVNGYLIDFNDTAQLEEAITRVLSHPESRERMTQSARLRSKDFQKQNVVEEMANILKRVHVGK
jgi:glycosyltransferase involved in cell wall biosynthesis